MTRRRIIAADSHRNGVCGRPFYVGLVKEDGRTMLVITFPGDDCATAAIDVDQAAAGNIYMHPTGDQAGGNAWRGDHYDDLGGEFERIVSARYDELFGRIEATS